MRSRKPVAAGMLTLGDDAGFNEAGSVRSRKPDDLPVVAVEDPPASMRPAL